MPVHATAEYRCERSIRESKITVHKPALFSGLKITLSIIRELTYLLWVGNFFRWLCEVRNISYTNAPLKSRRPEVNYNYNNQHIMAKQTKSTRKHKKYIEKIQKRHQRTNQELYCIKILRLKQLCKTKIKIRMRIKKGT